MSAQVRAACNRNVVSRATALAFDQFAMLPYIGDGSPEVQSFWVDDLVVATARP